MTQLYAFYNPDTHVAVPKEPTEEMVKASSRSDYKRAQVYYRAMLAAAPPHVVEASSEDIARAGYEAQLWPGAWSKATKGEKEIEISRAMAILKLLGVK